MKITGIGSLPHDSVIKAVAYSLRHDLPFLPQMTGLGERMISQVLNKNELSKKYQALQLFTEKILEKNISQFKIQLAGPETCGTSELLIIEQINSFLEFFDKYKLRPIIFIDEPVLTLKSDHLKKVFIELKNLGVNSGLHSCAQFEWEKIECLETTYISFDLNLIKQPEITSKIKIAGFPPFITKEFNYSGEWISSSCGLASYTEKDCETILRNLENHK